MESLGSPNRKSLQTGWMGHRDIPRPPLVRREHRHKATDWLDCVLTIWIAEAMLESFRRHPSSEQEPS
ncbi:MAG TPA: hypothetical protein VFV60_00980 [bacterium]|nr:hypothetical protein [bacterium]